MSMAAFLPDDLLTEGVITRRIIAWVIDVVLISVIVSALWIALFLFGLLTLGLGFGLMALLPLVPLLYHVLFLAGSGSATPGQRLLGLVVLREIDFGRPSLLAAVLSTVGFYITLATGVIWLAVALVTVQRRTLHDMLAGLVVVRARALPPRGFYPA